MKGGAASSLARAYLIGAVGNVIVFVTSGSSGAAGPVQFLLVAALGPFRGLAMAIMPLNLYVAVTAEVVFFNIGSAVGFFWLAWRLRRRVRGQVYWEWVTVMCYAYVIAVGLIWWLIGKILQVA